MATKPYKKLGDDYQNVAHFMIKNQPVGFLWADSSLSIQYISSELQNFLPDRHVQINELLTTHFPETVGLEAYIHQILIWQKEPLNLEYINLELANGELRYISLTLYAGRRNEKMGLFLVVKDTTESGRTIQELNQSRNELRLLKKQLELANALLSKINKVQGLNIVVAAQKAYNLHERSKKELAKRIHSEQELRTACEETLKGWAQSLNLSE